jgi:hypothetical protein
VNQGRRRKRTKHRGRIRQMQFSKAENQFEVRKALELAGRT